MLAIVWSISIYLDRLDLAYFGGFGFSIFIFATEYLIKKGYFYDCYRYKSKIKTIVIGFDIICFVINILMNMAATIYDGIYSDIYNSKVTTCIYFLIVCISIFILNWDRYNIFKSTGE